MAARTGRSCPRRSGRNSGRRSTRLKAERAPPRYRKALAAAMPEPRLAIGKTARRVAGAGSLGRPRWIGIADWRGGAGGARGQSARAIRLGARARQGQGQDPLRRDRQRPLPGDRSLASHHRRHCRCAACRPTIARSRRMTIWHLCCRRTCCAPWARSRRCPSGHGRQRRGHRPRSCPPQTRMAQDRCNQDGKGRRGRPRCMGGQRKPRRPPRCWRQSRYREGVEPQALACCSFIASERALSSTPFTSRRGRRTR